MCVYADLKGVRKDGTTKPVLSITSSKFYAEHPMIEGDYPTPPANSDTQTLSLASPDALSASCAVRDPPVLANSLMTGAFTLPFGFLQMCSPSATARTTPSW